MSWNGASVAISEKTVNDILHITSVTFSMEGSISSHGIMFLGLIIFVDLAETHIYMPTPLCLTFHAPMPFYIGRYIEHQSSV